MDMIKQSLAALVGSVILAGCLSDQPVLTVPSFTEPEDEDEDNETASLWPTALPLPPARPGGAGSALDGELPQRLAQAAPTPAAPNRWASYRIDAPHPDTSLWRPLAAQPDRLTT